MVADMSWMRERYEQLQSQGLNWNPPTLESASESRCMMDGKEIGNRMYHPGTGESVKVEMKQ